MEIERLPLPGMRLVAALYSMPVSTASILKSIADGAEVRVALMRRLEELARTLNVLVGTLEAPARALEPGMVRLAGVLDTDAVEQMVTTMPTLVQKLQEILDALAGPVPALAQIVNQQTVGRVGNLLDRLDATVPSLNTLPGTETELRESIDRLVGLMADGQRTFGALPGASLLLGRRSGGGKEKQEKSDKAFTAAAAPSAEATLPAPAAEEPAPAAEEPAAAAQEPAPAAEEPAAAAQEPAPAVDEPAPTKVRTSSPRKSTAGQARPKAEGGGKSGHRSASSDTRLPASGGKRQSSSSGSRGATRSGG